MAKELQNLSAMPSAYIVKVSEKRNAKLNFQLGVCYLFYFSCVIGQELGGHSLVLKTGILPFVGESIYMG